jgi:hypothetical protein
MHTEGSSGSQGQVQSALQSAPAPQSESGGSHCSAPSIVRFPQSGDAVVLVVLLVDVVDVLLVVVGFGPGQALGDGARRALKRPGRSTRTLPPNTAQ